MIFLSQPGSASISELPQVVLENDADTAGLAEARFGAGIGHSPLLYMNVGSGIGGALDRRSSDLPRASARARSRLGTCGCRTATFSGIGMLELEQVASGWAIASAAQELGSAENPARRQPTGSY